MSNPSQLFAPEGGRRTRRRVRRAATGLPPPTRFGARRCCQRTLRCANVLLMMLGLGAPATALDPGRAIDLYGIDTWLTDDGLPQSSVTALVQTRDGYLWMGTEEGVVRFDGQEFKVFNKRSSPAFQSNGIQTLFEDSRGVLWVGTFASGVVRFVDGVPQSAPGLDPLASASVRCIVEDRDGTLWFGTYSLGLHQLRDGSLTSFTIDEGLPANQISSLLVVDGGLWVGTLGAGLVFFDGNAFSTTTTDDGLPSNLIRCLYRDLAGALWIGTNDGGLSRMDETGIWSIGATTGLGADWVSAIMEDSDGNLWVGTAGGLNRIRGEATELLTEDDGLSGSGVLTLLEGREGSLWVGTRAGLDRLKDSSVITRTVAHGLSHNEVRTVFEDDGGDLWIGTAQGLSCMRAGRFIPFRFRDQLLDVRIFSLHGDASGALWIGTRGQGIRIMHGDEIDQLTRADGLLSDLISCFAEDQNGSVWIGSLGGLNQFRDGSLLGYTMADGLVDNTVLALLADPDGDLWIGTQAGLSRMRNGRFEDVPIGADKDTVSTLYRDDNGVLWIGTIGNGLKRLSAGGVTVFDTEVGLYDDVVYQILEDDNGRMWMSSNNGLFHAPTAQLNLFAAGEVDRVTCVALGTPDGMKNQECNGGSQPAGWKTRDGTLWFATVQGVAAVKPDPPPRNELAPPVFVEKIMVDNERVDVDEVLALPPGCRHLEIHYAGLSLVAPEKVRFRYKLQGYDREWVEAGAQRTAYYGALRPGPYTFRVTACNNDGVWNADGATVAVQQLPYFFQTWPFYALCAAGFLVLLAVGDRIRLRNLKARQSELVEQVADRTSELAVANCNLEKQKAELEHANQLLERLSSLDGLTGIANRRHFDEILDREWRRGIRARTPLATILVDIDDFKAYNDHKGHLAGDQCLIRVAQTLSKNLQRAGDLVARYGGEEFVILMPETDVERAAAMAEQLARAVMGLNIMHEKSRAASVVTISLGVAAAVPADQASAEGLLDQADRALYRAKAEGRNRVVVD